MKGHKMFGETKLKWYICRKKNMRKIYNIFLISAALAFILETDTFQAQAKQKVKYKLVFHDEFNLPDGS